MELKVFSGQASKELTEKIWRSNHNDSISSLFE